MVLIEVEPQTQHYEFPVDTDVAGAKSTPESHWPTIWHDRRLPSTD